METGEQHPGNDNRPQQRYGWMCYSVVEMEKLHPDHNLNVGYLRRSLRNDWGYMYPM